MSMDLDPVEERVTNALKRLQLTHLRETLPAVLSEAAKGSWTYLEFLDRMDFLEARGEAYIGATNALQRLEGHQASAQPEVSLDSQPAGLDGLREDLPQQMRFGEILASHVHGAVRGERGQ